MAVIMVFKVSNGWGIGSDDHRSSLNWPDDCSLPGMDGNEASNRLVDPGPQWVKEPRDYV